MNSQLNVGVVGCGYWGPNLIRNFEALKEASVTKICDLDESRLDHLKSLYPTVETTTNYENLVKDPDLDAIVVATPVHLHHRFGKKALENGKHTFIEKPMASSVEECVDLNRIATKNNLELFVGHTFLYTAAVRKMKEIIDSGDIGEVYYLSSRRLNLGLFQKDINVAWDLAPHDISIMLYLMDAHPVSINCQGNSHITPGIEDVTNMTLNFSNGGLATIHSSWLDPNKIREMTIVGSKKMIVFDDLEPTMKLKIFDKRVERPPHYDSFESFTYSYHNGDMHAPHLNHAEALKVEAQQFVDSILHNVPNPTNGINGLRIVQILEAADESLKTNGKAVPVHFSEANILNNSNGDSKKSNELNYLKSLSDKNTRIISNGN
jgi:predicted dehydrogenase